MRWFWLDRFTEFVSGSHATAVKCVSLSEDHLHDHWPDYPVMPNTLVAEGMAQCGGLLVSEVYRFSELVVLAKFAKCAFDGEVRPGDVLRYRRDDRASQGRRRIGHRDGPRRRPTAGRGGDFLRPARRRFARPCRKARGCSIPSHLLHWLRLVGVFDVGTRAGRHATAARRLRISTRTILTRRHRIEQDCTGSRSTLIESCRS